MPSVDRDVDDDDRSRELELLLEPEIDESTEPVAAPPRIVVSLPRIVVSLRTPRSSVMTVSLRAARPSRSS
ncbi:MAG TPA: hypothetical protein VHL99_02665 [Candidatus Binatia bacterium]|nr:hypothetical protein [Candidatus Binatia bacterium]